MGAQPDAVTPESPTPARAWLTSPWVAVAVAVVVFLPSLWAGYVFDDILLVRDNVYVHGFAHFQRALQTHFWDVYTLDSGDMAVYYRPLVTVSHMLDWVTGGGEPWAFHLTNLALHGFCCFLACRIAQRWLGSPQLGLLAGLLFAVHPTRVPSVVWIPGRSDLLMTAFVLATVECVHQAVKARRRAGWWAAAGALFVLGVLSKEVAALTALLVAVEAQGTAVPLRRVAWRATIAFAGLGVVYAAGRALVYPIQANQPFELTPRAGLLTTAAYLERLVWPWPQTFFHRPLIFEQGEYVYPAYLLVAGGLVVVGYTALLVQAWRRDRRALFLLLGAVAFIAPLLNFHQTNIPFTTSDHYLYLPLWLLVGGLLGMLRSRLQPIVEVRAARIGGLGLTLVMAAAVVTATLPYRDNDTYWQHELELNPHNALGLETLAISAARAGRPDEAYRLLRAIFDPESVKQRRLSSKVMPASYTRLLELRAGLTPDGDVPALAQIQQELGALYAGRLDLPPPQLPGMPTVDPQVRAQAARRPDRMRRDANRTVELAALATRLGHDDAARRLIDGLPQGQLRWAAAPANLVLTIARLGDVDRAEQLIDVLQAEPRGALIDAAVERDLRERLATARGLLAQAQAATPPTRQVQVALAMASLGAYLRALRAIRPAYAAAPEHQATAITYVQLLVAARLELEARSVAARAIGAARAGQVVAQLRGQLPPRLAAMKPPAEPSPWWNGQDDDAAQVPRVSEGLPAHQR